MNSYTPGLRKLVGVFDPAGQLLRYTLSAAPRAHVRRAIAEDYATTWHVLWKRGYRIHAVSPRDAR